MAKQQVSFSSEVNLGGLVMKNPVTVASGTFGAGQEYGSLFPLSLLGAVTTKGVSSVPWEGNESPRIAETSSGMLNSIGLQNPGVEAFCSEGGPLSWLSAQEVPVIVNVSGHSISEYEQVISYLEEHTCNKRDVVKGKVDKGDANRGDVNSANQLKTTQHSATQHSATQLKDGRVDAYEINISCPNVDAGGMTFGTDPVQAARVIAACRVLTKRPLIAKLTPNVTDVVSIATAVVEAGADALSLINTLLGMSINILTRKPQTARPYAGLSGPAIKPVALRMVHQVYQALGVPILGMGGIATWEDAVEFMLAGATAVAVGTANFTNPLAAKEIVAGLERFCRENSIEEISKLTGALEL